ncbi:sulfatase [Stieleria sp. TO1_6]|uniref:sulfatase n=1 Tax=Stieleria tagensis TaxID=2956795 RepID=UPI00209AE656|nr:sulfatase [Stieleria tagensis]MCO8124121.1 sulfatase [Stieleria tagensis]
MTLHRILVSGLVCFTLLASGDVFAQQQSRPNVLFIAIDDLNDWVDLFGGHPQAETPNLDRFARQGAVVFQNASCPGPVCGPSRSALLSGYMPHHSGVYGNAQNMRQSPLIAANPTLPEYFSQHGYRTISQGKIFHAHGTPGGIDRGQWAFQDWSSGEGGSKVDRTQVTSRDKNLIAGKPAAPSKYNQSGGSEFAFGPTVGEVDDTSDYKTAAWAAQQLQQPSDSPFFLAVGLSKPHLPFYVPQSFFDLYPIEQIQLPPIKEDDLQDIQTPAGKVKFSATNDYLWLREQGQMKQAVQAYLAAVSFADACIGKILEGLNDGPNADNTIVVIWGDHGWHLGEKLRFRKATGWPEATRCPLLIRTPAMTERADCQSVVNLIDLYPTLVDYCGLPAKDDLDGSSLVPLLTDPGGKIHNYTTTIFGFQRAAITDGHWHYARHDDETEELYDLKSDPMGWDNLAGQTDSQIEQTLQRFREQLPQQFAKPIDKTPQAVKKHAKGLNRDLKWPRSLQSISSGQ